MHLRAPRAISFFPRAWAGSSLVTDPVIELAFISSIVKRLIPLVPSIVRELSGGISPAQFALSLTVALLSRFYPASNFSYRV